MIAFSCSHPDRPLICASCLLRVANYFSPFAVCEITCQNGTIIAKGDVITIDGNSGEIILGEVKMQNPEISEELKYLLNWCGEFSPIKVRANADMTMDENYSKQGLNF